MQRKAIISRLKWYIFLGGKVLSFLWAKSDFHKEQKSIKTKRRTVLIWSEAVLSFNERKLFKGIDHQMEPQDQLLWWHLKLDH